jgi:hypothetical protein
MLMLRNPQRQAQMSKPSIKRVRSILKYDPKTGVLTWRKSRQRVRAGSIAGTIVSDGHRQVWLDYGRYQASHLIWVIVKGEWPPHGYQIEHRDVMPANDRWTNLRLATFSQNMANKKRMTKSSDYKGVHCVSPHQYKATITKNRKVHRLGTFNTPFKAWLAYRKAA